jgi:hypothetical protein
MALQISPKNQSRITEMIEQWKYPDADALIARALDLLAARERYAELRQMIAVGVDEVAQGKVIEFTPERREELWQRALAEAGANPHQGNDGQG